MDSNRKLTRRAALRTVGAAGGALLVLPVIGCGGGEADCSDMTGVDPAARQMRTTLHYVDAATDATRRCDGCALYEAPTSGACGGCQLFAGPIAPGGSCDSFAARP